MGKKIGIANVDTIGNYASKDNKIKSFAINKIYKGIKKHRYDSIQNQIYDQEMVNPKDLPTKNEHLYHDIKYSEITYQHIYFSKIIYH